MRNHLLLTLAAALVLVPRSQAADARAVVERAIKAYGGEDKLSQLKAVQAKSRGTVTLGGAAAGVGCGCKGQRHVRLFFDRETHLLVKVERLAFDDQTMKDVPQEQFFSDYKTVDGLPTPMHEVWTRAGKKGLELQYVEV